MAGWTEKRIEQLESLWEAGLSASQIGKALGGITRNSVIGKVQRLGLAGREGPSRSKENPDENLSEENKKVKALWEVGCGTRAIANILDMPRSEVIKRAKELKLSIHNDSVWTTPYAGWLNGGNEKPIDVLKELMKEDKSRKEYAAELTERGFPATKNSVTSALRRHVNPPSSDPISIAQGRKRVAGAHKSTSFNIKAIKDKNRKPPTPVEEKPLVEDPVVLEDGSFATLLTINGRMCRWPIGDPCENDFHFCGREPKEGSSYCEAHTRKAYQSHIQRARPPGPDRSARINI